MRLLVLALLLAPLAAAAQPVDDEPDAREVLARFDAATERYGGEYVALLATRAGNGPSPCERGWTGCESARLEYGFVSHLVEAYLGAAAPAGLLFYAAEGEDLDVWLIASSGGTAYARVPGGVAELTPAFASLQAALRVDNLRAGRTPGFATGAARDTTGAPPFDAAVRRASDLLLPAPVRPLLAGVERLVVVPAVGVSTVPFGLLRPYGSAEAVIDRATISVVPSLPDLVTALRRSDTSANTGGWGWTRDALVVGGPAYRPDGANPHLPPLPGARAEAEAVGRLTGARPLLGPEATLAAVRDRASGADLLYFATHGAADPEDPLHRGGLFFAGDSLWTVRDILDRDIGTPYLVVLSACQTALGRAMDAGTISLGRAFTTQGAENVVMSLWSVDDDATAFLMTRFTEHLQASCGAWACDVPEALRRAALDARERWPESPARWAPFVHFGVPNVGAAALRPPPASHDAFPVEILGVQRLSDGVVLRPDPASGVLRVPAPEVASEPARYRLAIGLTPEARAALEGSMPELRAAYVRSDFDGEACVFLPWGECGDRREVMGTSRDLYRLDLADLAPAPTASGDSVWVADLLGASPAFTLTDPEPGSFLLIATDKPFMEPEARQMQWRAIGDALLSHDPPAWSAHRLRVEVVPPASGDQ